MCHRCVGLNNSQDDGYLGGKSPDNEGELRVRTLAHVDYFMSYGFLLPCLEMLLVQY